MGPILNTMLGPMAGLRPSIQKSPGFRDSNSTGDIGFQYPLLKYQTNVTLWNDIKYYNIFLKLLKRNALFH
jgi:hypothetical protein